MSINTVKVVKSQRVDKHSKRRHARVKFDKQLHEKLAQISGIAIHLDTLNKV